MVSLQPLHGVKTMFPGKLVAIISTLAPCLIDHVPSLTMEPPNGRHCDIALENIILVSILAGTIDRITNISIVLFPVN